MATTNAPLIEIKDLSFGYNKNQEIISKTSCSVTANRFTVIMGRNGSGKSTLLRLTSGILPYQTGSIKIKGTELNKLKPGQRARHIGFLAQQHKAVFPFRVSEVVLTGRSPYITYLPGKDDQYEAARAMELAGIYGLKDRIYSELSGGLFRSSGGLFRSELNPYLNGCIISTQVTAASPLLTGQRPVGCCLRRCRSSFSYRAIHKPHRWSTACAERPG